MKQKQSLTNNSTHQTLEPKPLTKSSALLAKVKNSFSQWLKGPDITFEQWEKLERKYSPHASHHGQIYYRDRGL